MRRRARSVSTPSAAAARLCARRAFAATLATFAVACGALAQSVASPPATVTCVSPPEGRQHCPAYTADGVVLLRSTGTGTCLLGRSWGYDAEGVWVTEGCGGEFIVGRAAASAPPAAEPVEEAPPAAATATPAPAPPPPPGGPVAGQKKAAEKPFQPLYGEFTPGDGFLVGRNRHGELAISGYALFRYVNQNDDDQIFTDHLGNVRPVDPRNDFFSHRIMVFLKGWMGSPRFIYNITFWTVNATDQRAIFANLGYQFSRKFSLYGGMVGNPGSRSLVGSHPFWLGNDRVMADEFFRPYFGTGLFAQGELFPGFWYTATLTNNNSSLGVKASQLDRKLTTGATIWWMPTTNEFGPRGAYGDWEYHETLATRFGISTVQSPEQSFRSTTGGNPDNTTLRLADSVNLFETGALAPGVTIENADYQVVSLDAGMKYKGIFLQTELYRRKLDRFDADGPLPVSEVVDTGFYVQAAFYPIPKKLELYGATSQVYGDQDAGFDNSSEYLIGANFYPFDTRNHRLNVQLMDVNKSPVSSVFGYYTGGLDGFIAATAFSIFF